MTTRTHTFRAIWPILDDAHNIPHLLTEASAELPHLLAQTHATPTGQGRFTIADSTTIPGSGRITPWVLLYECPATQTPPRNYHHPKKEGTAA